MIELDNIKKHEIRGRKQVLNPRLLRLCRKYEVHSSTEVSSIWKSVFSSFPTKSGSTRKDALVAWIRWRKYFNFGDSGQIIIKSSSSMMRDSIGMLMFMDAAVEEKMIIITVMINYRLQCWNILFFYNIILRFTVGIIFLMIFMITKSFKLSLDGFFIFKSHLSPRRTSFRARWQI